MGRNPLPGIEVKFLMRCHRWTQKVVLGAFGALAIACGGGGGGGGGNPTPVNVSYSVEWADRSRNLDGGSAALSMSLRLANANSSGGDIVHSVNRGAATAAFTGNYTTSSQAIPGTYATTATFFAEANGGGAVVATAQADMTVQTDGSLAGAITTVRNIATVEVGLNQVVEVGQTVDLTYTAKNSGGGVIAVSPGSVVWNVVTGGSNLSFTNGSAQGVAEGAASVTASIDGRTSPPTNVSVVQPLNETWMIVSSDEGGDSEIARIRTNGTQYLEITNDPEIDFLGRPNTAGTQVVFESSRNGTGQVYIMNVDGSNVIQLTPTAGFGRNSEPAFSQDGTKVLFTSDRDGNNEIYVMGSDGSNPTQITTNGGSDTNARFNSSGTKIVFVSDRSGNPEVWIMDPDGGNPIKLTDTPAAEAYPSFSPDGTKIVFQSERDGNWEIYVMDVDGANPTRLTNNAARDEQPHFNAAGTTIAFASDRNGNFDIFTMSPTGTGQVGFLVRAGNQTMPNFVVP